jgi:KaiC/GvpD/RAD55 family RecA-like ATPase
MVKVGQFKLSNLETFAAVLTYAVAALILQIFIVVAFYFAKPAQKTKFLNKVSKILDKYTSQTIIVISTLLGIIITVIAFRNKY